MNSWKLRAIAGAVGICFPLAALAQVHVLTYHNNNSRTGENLEETTLTPANVNSRTFGKLFVYPVDGYVYAQPLYVSALDIPGQGVHNVVFVATQHNSVYAFDADSNSGAAGGLLWQVSLGPSAATPSPDFGTRFGGYDDIIPEVGITSTPVIDLASGTLYVDAFTHEGSSYYHKIHALDITSGAERVFSPVTVSASIPGLGIGSTNGAVAFEAKQQIQRAALTLSGGVLYVAFASYADTKPFHGWVIGFRSADLLQLPNHIFNSTPNSTDAEFGEDSGGGGIWMSGCGLTVDADNNLYFATGDGSFNAFSGGTEYGNSIIKLSSGSGLSVADYFTPHNQAFLAANNLDLGSGGVMLLPDQSGPFPHLMIVAGKSSLVYLMNRDMFTAGNQHYNPTGSVDFVVQTVSLHGGAFDTPAYFNGTIYYAGTKDVLTALSLSNGELPNLPSSVGPRTFGFPGATPSVSANGTRDGIIWALQRASPAVLAAYNATNLSREIYHSSQAGTRDQLTAGVKFAVPTIANGKVYVGSQYALSVFGLLASAPTLSPASYSGLFYETGGVHFGASGSITATTTRRGTFSGKLQTGGRHYSFSGQFDSSGSVTKTISRQGDTPLTLALQLDVTDGSRITGTVSDGTWVAEFTAYRAEFNARTKPAPFAGKYTLILPGPADGNSQTAQGDSYGALTVDQSGRVRFKGALADGTRLSQSATISQDGQWPLYIPLYQGGGQLLGWASFTSAPAKDLAGQVSWIKLPNSRSVYYPAGFELDPMVKGSAYQPPARNTPILNFVEGQVTLTGENLTDSILNYVILNASNKVGNQSSNKLAMTLTLSSGVFRGTVVSPAGGKPIAFSGVVLQDQNVGSGYFLLLNQSGRVYFGPR